MPTRISARESNTPGWMTDMGRTWILFGAPTSRHPFVGYSQIYPFELWFYENKTELPVPARLLLSAVLHRWRHRRVQILPAIHRWPHEAGARLPVQLATRTSTTFSSHWAATSRTRFFRWYRANLSTLVNYTPEMGSDMLIARFENFANDPFNVSSCARLRSLHAKVNSYFMVDQNRPLGISSLVLADPAGKSWLDYGVLIDDAKLGQRDGAQMKVSISYRLTTAAGDTILEDARGCAPGRHSAMQRRRTPSSHPFEIAEPASDRAGHLQTDDRDRQPAGAANI